MVQEDGSGGNVGRPSSTVADIGYLHHHQIQYGHSKKFSTVRVMKKEELLVLGFRD